MTWPENYESSEWEVNKSKKTESELYNELVRWFTWEYIWGLKASQKNTLVETIMKTEVLAGTEVEAELKKYIATKDEFTWLDISRVNIYQLRTKVAAWFLSLKSKKQNFKKQVLSQYDITEKVFDGDVWKILNTVSAAELEMFMQEEHQREEFLEKIFWKKLDKRTTLTAISKLTESEVRKRLSKIGSPEKEEIVEALERASRGQKIDQTDIQNFLSSGFLNSAEAREVVYTFIPFLTLQKAVDIWLLSRSEAEKQREKIVSETIKSEKLSVDSDAQNTLFESLSLSDIEIATKDFKPKDAEVQKIAEKVGFRNFEKTLEASTREQVEDFKKQGPATFDLMKQGIITLQKPNLQGFDKLTEGSYVKTTTKNSEWEHSQFLKIHSYDDTAKEFRFQLAGHESVNLTPGSEIESFAYAAFFENLKKTSNTIQVFSWNEMREWVKSGDIESSELQSYSPSDFEWLENAEKKQQVQQTYIEQTQNEIDALTEKLSRVDSDPTIRKGLVEKQIKFHEGKLEELQTTSLTLEETAEQATFQSFVDKLDSLDSEWKTLWFKNGLSIETKDNNAYIVRGINTQTEEVVLEWIKTTNEKVSYGVFLEAFKEKKAKRVAWLESVTELLDRVSWPQNWWEVAFEGGDIVAKKIDHPGEKPEQTIEYLKGTDSDTLVKINSIDDRYVEIQRGEIKDITKEEKGKKVTDQELKIKGAPVEKYTLNEFAAFVEWEKLQADWKLSKKQLAPVSPDGLHNDISKKWVWSHLYAAFVKDKLSIWGMMHGLKSVHESLTESLTKWSELEAARFALKMWKLLPDELQQELFIKVEQKEAESMDKELEGLKKIDSIDAIKRIEKWLLDSTTPEYKKEAATLFMVEWYGHLTTKLWWKNGEKWLYQYRWKFLFYEALGGRINDELYTKLKNDLENDDDSAQRQVFSEEILVQELLKQQCWGRHYSGIKRRTRIHKEYKGKWLNGIEEDLEKGKKEAAWKRTGRAVVDEAMGELFWGTMNNAFGRAEIAGKKWWDLMTMMQLSFCVMFSGACFNIPEESYKKIKDLWSEGQPVISHRFMSSIPEMKLFNKTVLELSKDIADPKNYGSRYPNIYTDALEIQKDVANWVKEVDILKKTQKFWMQYGDILSKALNFSMESSNETSKTDTIIKRKKNENSVYSEYYKKANSFVDEPTAFKEDYVSDWGQDVGIYGLNTYKISKKYFEISNGWGFRKSGAEGVWNKMQDDINATPDKILEWWETLDSGINREAQRNYIATQLEEIVAGLVAAQGWNPGYLKSANENTSPIWSQFNKWWLHVINDFWDFNAKEIKKGANRAKALEVADRIIAWNTADSSMWSIPDEFNSKAMDSLRGSAKNLKDFKDPYGDYDDDEVPGKVRDLLDA